MKQIIRAMVITVGSSMAFAQTQGMPTQTGGQEPEIPGNPPAASERPPSVPENVPVPKTAQPQKHDRKARIGKHTKCVQGQDANKCRDQQRGRK
ncbi:hypothetical protein [Ochrobactrum sp. RH2CCR150]|uniref:hypothetical protein n=1 Tax=Ochrobactrum sp. RH2CCR150 TaxID=2587044 RepID=UPI0015FCC9E4|nr:hypothetical protein [Ochrobactrum sp. RH2CCR150]